VNDKNKLLQYYGNITGIWNPSRQCYCCCCTGDRWL